MSLSFQIIKMNARNKKSKNAAYKNRKNKLAAEQDVTLVPLWRQVAENPVFWSLTTIVVDRRNGSLHTLTVDRRTGSPYKLWVDSRNGSLFSEILSSRRMQPVRENRIWSRGLSEEGWRNVAEHPGREGR